MPFKNTPRRGADRARTVYFTYLRELKGGTKFTGYIAGATWWGLVHPSERTQPCFDELTGGDLHCPHCARGAVPAIKGVCPLYIEPPRKPFFVWLDEELRDVVDTLKLHTKVIVGREVGKGMPAWVARCLNQEPAFTTTLPERQRPADITPTLLKIFRSPELVAWYNRTHGESDNAVSLPEPGKQVTGWNRFVELGSGGKKEGKITAEEPPIGTGDPDSDVEVEFLRAVQEGRASSGNGHTKKKKPKKE